MSPSTPIIGTRLPSPYGTCTVISALFPIQDPPDIATSYEVGRLQVNLFDAQSGKLQWACNVKTSEPGDIVTVAKELTRIIVQKLTEEGFI